MRFAFIDLGVRGGFMVPRKTAKRRRRGSADGGIVHRKRNPKIMCGRSTSSLIGRRWSSQKARLLVDESTREFVASAVGPEFTGQYLVDVLSTHLRFAAFQSSLEVTIAPSLSHDASVSSRSRSILARPNSNLAVLSKAVLLRASTAISAMST